MLAAMTAKELRDWEAYYQTEPFGEQRADLRNGILCSLTDACHRTKGQPQPPSAYMPFVKSGKPQRQSIEDQKAIFARAQAAWGRKGK